MSLLRLEPGSEVISSQTSLNWAESWNLPAAPPAGCDVPAAGASSHMVKLDRLRAVSSTSALVVSSSTRAESWVRSWRSWCEAGFSERRRSGDGSDPTEESLGGSDPSGREETLLPSLVSSGEDGPLCASWWKVMEGSAVSLWVTSASSGWKESEPGKTKSDQTVKFLNNCSFDRYLYYAQWQFPFSVKITIRSLVTWIHRCLTVCPVGVQGHWTGLVRWYLVLWMWTRSRDSGPVWRRLRRRHWVWRDTGIHVGPVTYKQQRRNQQTYFPSIHQLLIRWRNQKKVSLHESVPPPPPLPETPLCWSVSSSPTSGLIWLSSWTSSNHVVDCSATIGPISWLASCQPLWPLGPDRWESRPIIRPRVESHPPGPTLTGSWPIMDEWADGWPTSCSMAESLWSAARQEDCSASRPIRGLNESSACDEVSPEKRSRIGRTVKVSILEQKQINWLIRVQTLFLRTGWSGLWVTDQVPLGPSPWGRSRTTCRAFALLSRLRGSDHWSGLVSIRGFTVWGAREGFMIETKTRLWSFLSWCPTHKNHENGKRWRRRSQ